MCVYIYVYMYSSIPGHKKPPKLTQPLCFEAHTDEASTQPASVVSINH